MAKEDKYLIRKIDHNGATHAYFTLDLDGVMLPNGIDLEQLSRLLAYSDKYEISIQFWPKQIAVYIAKDGVDLQDYGGDFDFSIGRSIEYLDKVTGNER